MSKIISGLLMYRFKEGMLEVFLVHHGGPYFKNKDDGFWSLPKGHMKKDENVLGTAKREFEEETGIFPEGEFIPLGKTEGKNNKILYAWGFERDWDGFFRKNMIEIEYPFNSGNKITIPEVDKVEFFNLKDAFIKLEKNQIIFLKKLKRELVKKKITKLKREFLIKLKEKIKSTYS